MEIQEIQKEKRELEEEMNDAINEFMERIGHTDIDVIYEVEQVSHKGVKYLSKSQFSIIVKI